MIAEFVWTNQCDISFQMLKDTLCSAPVLKYPDTRKLYMLYTDASKYGWAGVLTQRHTSAVNGKEITMDHPVSYVSGLFWGSQLNWAALTKEEYAIYMSIKRSIFYLTGHEITLREWSSTTQEYSWERWHSMNTVNNWSTEIESFQYRILCIFQERPMSLLIPWAGWSDTDPELKQQPGSWKDDEFGKYCFETLPNGQEDQFIMRRLVAMKLTVCEIQITYDNPNNLELLVELPLEDDKVCFLAAAGPKNLGTSWQG